MRLVRWLVGVCLASAFSLVTASDGLKTITSAHNVERTMNRLERAVRTAGFRVFARVDHSRGADRVGIRLRPTQVLIFGKPEAGSALLQADQRIGIDLPMKFLVWMDKEGRTQVSWNLPGWLAARHEIDDLDPVVDTMGRALEEMARDAAAP
jgi:uncharacterized protein (DUF302 family)